MEQTLVSVLLKLYAWSGYRINLPSEAILAYAKLLWKSDYYGKRYLIAKLEFTDEQEGQIPVPPDDTFSSRRLIRKLEFKFVPLFNHTEDYVYSINSLWIEHGFRRLTEARRRRRLHEVGSNIISPGSN